MNLSGPSIGLTPVMGGIGHVIQASEKQDEPKADEHVIQPGHEVKQAEGAAQDSTTTTPE